MGRFHPGGDSHLPSIAPVSGGGVLTQSDLADLAVQLVPAVSAAFRETAAESQAALLAAVQQALHESVRASIDTQKRQSPARDKVQTYLQNHPEALKLSA